MGFFLIALGACEREPGPEFPGPRAEPTNDCVASSGQDVVSTHLELNLEALRGLAELRVCPGPEERVVTLDTTGLDVQAVRVSGHDVAVNAPRGTLRVPLPAVDLPADIEIEYTFEGRDASEFDGWMPALGVSLTWPEYCGNLFPCDPRLADGVVVDMRVSGFDPALTAIYPASTHGDGPSYMPAIAVGDYTQVDLGRTSSGTQLYAWHLPDYANASALGTAHLLDAFDFFERTYGPYPFGPEAGTVQVDWGPGSFGGMEHHPYWHVGKSDFHVEETQVHEAGHGWFGNGARPACWEDFVLSEGTDSYITARALEVVGGPDVWSSYVDDYLAPICKGWDTNPVVLPDQTCNEIDFLHHDVWSLATYIKGACFYQEVAKAIGPEALDAILAEFFVTHVGRAARMQDMIELLAARVDAEGREAIEVAVTDWLRTEACPVDYAERCSPRAAQ